MDVVTRIAPSPTGYLHLGTARAALFNYLWARKNGGKFIIRIENTDKERDKSEFEAAILENLAWLGIEHDELYRQSDHNDAHKAAIQKLLEKDAAYISKEPSKDDANKEVEVVRFRNPNKEITFIDLVRGDVTFDTTDLKDFVIARSVDDPLHHLAVVVDDADEGVTLAMRGEDLLSNTPRQILIREALDLPSLQYLHLPLILAPDRTKLSKRKHAASIGDFRDKGYLPEALLNYIAFLGWHPGTDEEIFTKDELTDRFTLDQIQKAGAMFDEVKLRWFNREHLMQKTDEEFISEIKGYFSQDTLETLEKIGRFERLIPELRERIEVYSDIADMEEAGEFDYFTGDPEYEKEELFWKKDQNAENTKRRLEEVQGLLEGLEAEKWASESVKEALWAYAEKEGKGEVLWPLRYALSGKDKSPDPFSLAAILGKDETVKRVSFAVEYLS